MPLSKHQYFSPNYLIFHLIFTTRRTSSVFFDIFHHKIRSKKAPRITFRDASFNMHFSKNEDKNLWCQPSLPKGMHHSDSLLNVKYLEYCNFHCYDSIPFLFCVWGKNRPAVRSVFRYMLQAYAFFCFSR